MFKCEISNTVSEPLEKPFKVVLQKRPVSYFRRFENEDTRQVELVHVSNGWEIVKEVQVREDVYKGWKEAGSQSEIVPGKQRTVEQRVKMWEDAGRPQFWVE